MQKESRFNSNEKDDFNIPKTIHKEKEEEEIWTLVNYPDAEICNDCVLRRNNELKKKKHLDRLRVNNE